MISYKKQEEIRRDAAIAIAEKVLEVGSFYDNTGMDKEDYSDFLFGRCCMVGVNLTDTHHEFEKIMKGAMKNWSKYRIPEQELYLEDLLVQLGEQEGPQAP